MVCLWTTTSASAEEVPLYEASLLFDSESLRLQNGRVSHNHSPSLVETPGGNLIACWFHGHGERGDNLMVVLGARRNRGAAGWSKPFLMADHKNLPDQNPTLFVDPRERLWLFRSSSLDNEVRGQFVTYRISTDYEADGPPRWTWQAPLFCFPRELEKTYVEAVDQAIAAGSIPEDQVDALLKKKLLAREKLWHRLGWMPRQPPIMLNEHRMMLGLYSDFWGCSMAAFTENGGETWEFSEPMIFPEWLLTLNVQPSFVLKNNGNVVAFMRGRRGKRKVQRAESGDGGLTWTEDPCDIECNDSSVAVLGLKSGHWLLAVNDVRGRSVLTVYLSDDEGRTWNWRRALERFEPGQGSGQYPTLIQSADGSIHIVYTHQDAARFDGRTIKHVRFNEAWVIAGDGGRPPAGR